MINTKYRTNEEEIMDDFSIEGPVLNDALDKLATINKLLGGNIVTLNGLKILLNNKPKDKLITIIDLGCGGGDILRSIASYGMKKSYNFQLIGVDANKNATDYATKLSVEYDNFITIPVKNKMIIEDGLTSVLRGFKRKEIEAFLKQLNSHYQLKWKWAFRYQWILKK